MNEFADLLGAIVGKHRCSFIAEDGEFGCVCICGWSFHSERKETHVGKLINNVVLAALVHTEPRKDSTTVEASTEPGTKTTY